ncbi:hypothetical protein PQX77_005429 [Marasmius sp. AFHP31]|nr:hypothetical protein PQX77_005429 [Marasmius sp. AFHP31]
MGLLLATTLILGVALWLARTRSRSRSLPPGPPADPFIGHLRAIPVQKTPDTFHEGRKTHGDVMCLEVLGRETVVLGSVEAAQALRDSRSANYSCRPNLPIFEIMGFTADLAFMQYGNQFLKHRQMFQQTFGVKESLTFNNAIAEEARLLVKNLTHAAHGTHPHFFHRYAVSNIMRAAFGHQVRSDDDFFLEIGNGVSDVSRKCGPTGNTPVDFFPWLRYLPAWFPGTHYATVARSQFQTVRRLYDYPLKMVQDRMKTQNYEKCFASEKLQELDDDPDAEDLEDFKGAAATVFGAGADTTYATLMLFCLAMVLHPECQKRAYEEIISVVGKKALPDLSDRESLPTVECIVQGVLRWNVIAPFSVPHRAINEDVYNGTFIPKGAVVIPNVRGMSMDEDVYSNPRVFDPARFLPKPDGKGEPLSQPLGDSVESSLLLRVCPGRHFASLALCHAIACTLATLELVPKKDEIGNPKLPEAELSEGLVCEPLPFEFDVHPRSEAAKTLIEQIESYRPDL